MTRNGQKWLFFKLLFFLQTIYFHIVFKKGNSLENYSFKTLGKHLIQIIVLQKVTYLT